MINAFMVNAFMVNAFMVNAFMVNAFLVNAFLVNAFMPNSFMQTVFMHTPSGKNWIMIDCCKNKQIDRSSDDLYCTNSINLTVTSHRHYFKNTKNPSNSVLLLTNSVNTFLIW
jgi:hypothetical protein